MGKIKYYDNGMVNKTFRFPDDVAEWIESTENASQIIRDIILRICQFVNSQNWVVITLMII